MPVNTMVRPQGSAELATVLTPGHTAILEFLSGGRKGERVRVPYGQRDHLGRQIHPGQLYDHPFISPFTDKPPGCEAFVQGACAMMKLIGVERTAPA